MLGFFAENFSASDTQWRPFPLKRVRSHITGKVETGAPTGKTAALLSAASEPDGVANGEIAVAIGSGNHDQASERRRIFISTADFFLLFLLPHITIGKIL